MPIRNVLEKYPPTFLMHGDRDTDVPYNESVEMAAELTRHRIENRLVVLPGGEHGFSGADPKAVNQAYQDAWLFLSKHFEKR